MDRLTNDEWARAKVEDLMARVVRALVATLMREATEKQRLANTLRKSK